MMVAVGFNPRFTAFHEGSRRGATPETTLPFGTRPHQASRRDASFISPLEPWVETHGYPPGSLRDLGKPTRAEHQARNRSPELCIKTRVRPPAIPPAFTPGKQFPAICDFRPGRFLFRSMRFSKPRILTVVFDSHLWSSSVCRQPVRAGAVFDFDGHAVGQRQGGFHGVEDERDEFVLFVEGEVEDEFVVDLEQHLRLIRFLP